MVDGVLLIGLREVEVHRPLQIRLGPKPFPNYSMTAIVLCHYLGILSSAENPTNPTTQSKNAGQRPY